MRSFLSLFTDEERPKIPQDWDQQTITTIIEENSQTIIKKIKNYFEISTPYFHFSLMTTSFLHLVYQVQVYCDKAKQLKPLQRRLAAIKYTYIDDIVEQLETKGTLNKDKWNSAVQTINKLQGDIELRINELSAMTRWNVMVGVAMSFCAGQAAYTAYSAAAVAASATKYGVFAAIESAIAVAHFGTAYYTYLLMNNMEQLRDQIELQADILDCYKSKDGDSPLKCDDKIKEIHALY